MAWNRWKVNYATHFIIIQNHYGLLIACQATRDVGAQQERISTWPEICCTLTRVLKTSINWLLKGCGGVGGGRDFNMTLNIAEYIYVICKTCLPGYLANDTLKIKCIEESQRAKWKKSKLQIAISTSILPSMSQRWFDIIYWNYDLTLFSCEIRKT